MSNMESRFFTLSNGLKIHADMMGKGPLLICLSGYANTNHNFKLLAPFLAQRYMLCMIDARGMGKSSPAQAEYKMDDLAQDAYEIAGLLGAQEFGVLGISLGGYPAQLMAMRFPQAVKAMVLIASRGPGKEYQVKGAVTEEGFTAFMKMDKEQADRFAVAGFVHPSFVKNHPEKLEAVIKLRKEENKITLEQSLMQLRAGYRFVESELDMNKVVCPTLIIGGAEDNFLPEQNSRLLHQQIKNSELVFIPETSHLCFFEKPEEIAGHILRFMEKKV